METISIVRAVGSERVKTEHAGAKNGGGAWMTRAAAKQSARRKRRQIEKALKGERSLDDWGTWTSSAHRHRAAFSATCSKTRKRLLVDIGPLTP